MEGVPFLGKWHQALSGELYPCYSWISCRIFVGILTWLYPDGLSGLPTIVHTCCHQLRHQFYCRRTTNRLYLQRQRYSNRFRVWQSRTYLDKRLTTANRLQRPKAFHRENILSEWLDKAAKSPIMLRNALILEQIVQIFVKYSSIIA